MGGSAFQRAIERDVRNIHGNNARTHSSHIRIRETELTFCAGEHCRRWIDNFLTTMALYDPADGDGKKLTTFNLNFHSYHQ